VWRRHRRGGRLCTPLLLTADLLLSRTALRDLQPPESALPEQVGWALTLILLAHGTGSSSVSIGPIGQPASQPALVNLLPRLSSPAVPPFPHSRSCWS
jgi:hypothetical protein